MGKINRNLFAVLLFIPILLGVFASCDNSPSKTGTLMDFVPENAAVVFKISNFENLQADIENSALLSKFENTEIYSYFTKKNNIFKNLHPTSQSLLSINKINDSVSAYTFITKHTDKLFQLDSVKNKSVETLTLDKKSFQRVSIDENTAYSTIIDSVLVVSSSQQIIQDILNGKTERDATFKKVFNLPSSNDFTALLRGKKEAINDSIKINFTSWSALDINFSSESFTATGISMATDTIPQLLNIFEGQIPQQNDVALLIPSDAKSALSFTFNDAESIQEKIRHYKGETKPIQTTGIFGSVSEAGIIELKQESAIFIKSIDALLTSDALARFVTSKSSFREVEIKSFSEPKLFAETFSPLINSEKANYVFQLDNFFVFTESEISAQQIISDYQNNNTLQNTSYFENTIVDLSTASSLLVLKLQGDLSESLSLFFENDNTFKKISFEKFPLAAIQFSYDRNFAHVTLSCKEVGGNVKKSSEKVSEKFNVKLENTILNAPKLVKTKNGESKIVVQDITNKLYFISESGKILWSKNLDSAVLGEVEEVSISGNKHIAFTTKSAFYLLDRNGKDSKSFPIKFKDEVTQPLSVFDYDNNGNYRFVVIQDKEVLMYDKNAKLVTGFGFKKAKSSIVQSPIHIRMGSKDYIVIAEENGSLNILSRVGKSRVSVSKKFNFSSIPIAEEDNTFVVITKENTKERITPDGKVSSLKLDVGANYWFTISGNTKATLDDNLLRINGKLAELPLGIYTQPQLYKINRNYYTTITETQEKKVYVFDENGKLQNGFPVYGTSEASLSQGKRTTNLVVKGGADSVIMYSM
ncbi:hypothetical protein [Aequorivita xiaoshiensis]|uniref:Uncharacterized protein n=1 Tax=Aequorivita xiaoshiensis TaxID=2874476 RepID=A0A9X1R349_9FLAO|nr:hypothetical protein [Aequorivita xiaoshiensis]MCG2431411.1 hypothetical protein [Aequorivita xiaoshiensis]